jgi:hypothetical protein
MKIIPENALQVEDVRGMMLNVMRWVHHTFVKAPTAVVSAVAAV